MSRQGMPASGPAGGYRPGSDQSFQSNAVTGEQYGRSERYAPRPASSAYQSFEDGYSKRSSPTEMEESFLPYDRPFSSGGHSSSRDRYLARMEQRQSMYANGGVAGAAGGAARSRGSSSDAYRVHQNRGLFEGRRKWFWIVGAIVVLAILGGVIGGILAAQQSRNRSESGYTGVVDSDSNDPSKFKKNPALHQSFYGMCYTPLNAQYPACGDTLEAVIEDVQLMSQLTTRLRTYGADCDVPRLVLEAIKRTKVDMQVYLAAWVAQPFEDPADETWNRQLEAVLDAVREYGADNIAGIAVGNEYLLNGGPEDNLINKITEMRERIEALNLDKRIPVGTGDAGSMITETLAAGSDFVMANVHAWFSGATVEASAGWVYTYSSTNTPAVALQAPNRPELFIAESGWPSGANETRFLTHEGGVAGIPELQTYLDTYICQANANVTAGGVAADFSKYFYFEAFDEPWKDDLYGGVEAHWGLFTADKRLKEGLTIPDCQTP